jgi:uncharacterized membrane protein YcaP (DUF421 family)
MFFSSWYSLLRIVVVGVAAYVAVLIMMRVVGKRSLSKMNAFDFVVTVAIGSTFGSMLMNERVTLADGLVALGMLAVLQLVFAWMACRWPRVGRVLKAEPAMVMYKGRMLKDAMRREHVTENEVLAAVRAQGILELDDVAAVVFEMSGTMSVVRRDGPVEGIERGKRDSLDALRIGEDGRRGEARVYGG